MKEQILALLYHPSSAVRSQGAELAIALGEAPLTVGSEGVVEAPLGVHGPALRVLLEASSAVRAQVRTLYLALDEESRALLPRLVELPNLGALHLLGEGPLDLAPLEELPLKTLTVGGAYVSAGLPGLERLAGLEALVVRGSSASLLPDLRNLAALRTLRLSHLPELDRLPAGLTGLRFDFLPDADHLRELPRLPLEELALRTVPREFTPDRFPDLRALRTWTHAEDFERLLPWPLERLELSSPSDDALRALAEHPTLRALTLNLASSDEGATGRDVRFDPDLLARMTRLEVFASDTFSLDRTPALPWPPQARCPLLWAQIPGRWGEALAEDVRERSSAGWQAAGYRWRVRVLAPAGSKIAAIKVIRGRWGFGLRDSKDLYEAAAGAGLPLLTEHTARALQAALLAAGEPAVIEPMSAEIA